jgi:hypothetical protein
VEQLDIKPISWIETLCEYANLNYYLQSQEGKRMANGKWCERDKNYVSEHFEDCKGCDYCEREAVKNGQEAA